MSQHLDRGVTIEALAVLEMEVLTGVKPQDIPVEQPVKFDLVVGFIALHVLAAFYHQFVRKDGLFRRMFFGRRVPSPSALAE